MMNRTEMNVDMMDTVNGGLSPKDKHDWQEWYCKICEMYRKGEISGEYFDRETEFFNKKMSEAGCVRN